MPSGIIKDIKIRGISCAVPENVVKTEEYAGRYDRESVDKFINMTGIKARHIAVGEQCVSDLCFVAAQKMLNHLDWAPESIGALIYITGTPDYKLPSTACVLQYRLGLSSNCAAFDVNLGCSAYVYGIWLVSTILQNSNINRALLLVGNQNNINIDPEDRSTAMLFGDAGSATALERSEGGSIKYSLKTRGEGFKKIIVPAGSARNRNCPKEPYLHADGTFRSDYKYYLNGTDVFNFTYIEVPKIVKELMQAYDINENDIDLYIMHQANLFILQKIASKLKIPMTKLPICIDTFGNTSGASIPLTLVTRGFETDKNSIRAMMCGFGVGLSWGAIYTDIEKSVCLPLIYTNDYFKGGSPEDE